MQEISLRDLIEIMLKGKWFIAVFTTICILLSGIVSFFFMTPTYEAQTMLMISPITNTASVAAEENKFYDLVESLSQYPQMTVDTYKEQVKAPVILDYIRTSMKMNNVSLDSIAGKIKVEAINNTNLLTVSVTDQDPQTAAKIANLVSSKFTDFVSQTSQKQAENSAKFIKSQQDAEKTNLENALKELKDFVAKPRGPQELKLELESKLTQLTDFKTKAAQLKIDLDSTTFSLEHGKQLLSNTQKTIVTTKSILEDDFLADIIKDKTGSSTQDISGLKLSSEEINEVYVEAAKKVNGLDIEKAKLTSELQNTELQIAVRQKEIEALQAELADKQEQYDILNHNVDLSRQTYDAYQQKYKEAMIKQSAEIGKSSIIVVSQAVAPMSPVSPKKAQNVAIAAVFGLVISMFGVFMREYWKSGSNLTLNS